MNTETGQIYRGAEAIGAAVARGEPVVAVSDRVASAVEAGMNREERRARRFGRRTGTRGRGAGRGVSRVRGLK